MRSWLLVLCACGGAATPPPAPSAAGSDPADRMLARLDRAVGCDRGGSVWCIATRGWDTGSVAPIPDGAHPGISIALPEAESDADLARGDVFFTVMSVRDGKVLVTDVPPQSASEQKLLDAAADSVERALLLGESFAKLPKALDDFLHQVPARYPLVKEPAEWRFSGKAQGRIRRVGERWVVVETPGEGPAGVMLSIFY